MSPGKNKMYETIKKFLDEGGRCLLIENGKPIGVVLTMEEYELIRSKSPAYAEASNEKPGPVINSENPIGETMVEEMNFPSASANIDEINLADAESVTLEDLGLDELPY